MPETICRSCGSELAASSECELCGVAINFICPNCGYAPAERVHVDCMNALLLVSSAPAS